MHYYYVTMVLYVPAARADALRTGQFGLRSHEKIAVDLSSAPSVPGTRAARPRTWSGICAARRVGEKLSFIDNARRKGLPNHNGGECLNKLWIGRNIQSNLKNENCMLWIPHAR